MNLLVLLTYTHKVVYWCIGRCMGGWVGGFEGDKQGNFTPYLPSYQWFNPAIDDEIHVSDQYQT